MANNATPTGEIRPNTATSTTSAAGTVEWRWVREATVIKRVRRKLALRGHALLVARDGSAVRRELGRFAVIGERHEILSANCELEALARFLGVLDDGERVELPPPFRRHYVARHVVEEADGGRRIHYDHRLTRDYTTLDAAQRAAAKFDDDGVVIVSYAPFLGYAERREVANDAL